MFADEQIISFTKIRKKLCMDPDWHIFRIGATLGTQIFLTNSVPMLLLLQLTIVVRQSENAQYVVSQRMAVYRCVTTTCENNIVHGSIYPVPDCRKQNSPLVRREPNLSRS
jgi:hypothetical protein